MKESLKATSKILHPKKAKAQTNAIFGIKIGKITLYHLNYAPYYTLHSKLFECILCTLNYDICYTLHTAISFTVKWDGNMKHMTCTCVAKWHKLKRPNPSSSQSIKNKLVFFFLVLSHAYQVSTPLQNPYNPKSLNQNHLWHHHCSTTTTPPKKNSW